MTAGDPVVVVDGLVKRYGSRTVLDGVSLSIAAGELVALLGPNGSGKTTTVEIVEGYRRRDGGQVRVLDTDPGGERQRLGLALALVGRPEAVFLDEPTAGMDPQARAATRAIVADLRDTGVAILLTSHDLADVERLADRICILDRGRIVASGSPAELTAMAHPRLRFRLDRALAPDEIADLERALAGLRPGTTVVTDGDAGRYRLEAADPDASLVAGLARWCAEADRLIVELRTSGGSLEDVYLELVGPGREARSETGSEPRSEPGA